MPSDVLIQQSGHQKDMMHIGRVFFVLLLFAFVVGCSWTGKAIYFEPVEQTNWNLKVYENNILRPPAPPTAEYRCDRMTLVFRSSEAGQRIYTGGPMLVPVIPMFGMIDIQPGREGIEAAFSIEGLIEDPALDTSSLYLIVDQDGRRINADEFKVRHFDNSGSHYYNYHFKSSLLGINRFTVVLDKTLQNCTIPSIMYEVKDYMLFCPFWLPAAAYR